MSNNFSDPDLISRYRETGDKVFAATLFQRYTHLVLGVCLKYLKDRDESQDAVMQIFEKLLNDLKKHEITSFKSWLYSVAKNHCLMHLRSKKTEMKRMHELKKDFPIVMESDYEMHQDNERDKEMQLNRLEDGIIQLKDEQRICIELFYLKEKCYQEVAQITGYSMNEVKSHIQNGKRNLKNYLISQG